MKVLLILVIAIIGIQASSAKAVKGWEWQYPKEIKAFLCIMSTLDNVDQNKLDISWLPEWYRKSQELKQQQAVCEAKPTGNYIEQILQKACLYENEAATAIHTVQFAVKMAEFKGEVDGTIASLKQCVKDIKE